jgi:hypothetical protein
MAKYLKEFETTAAYEAAQSSLILPNVSFTLDNNTVHYNPSVDPCSQHEYVEIGGIKWATKNIGACNVTDNGLYFQWGDTSGYTASDVLSMQKNFGWGSYIYGGDINGGQTKYNEYTDAKTVLDASDDAVTAAWGSNWRMPTKDEYQTLSTATTSTWTSDYEGSGVAGLVLTSKEDSSKKLFFPAVGYCYEYNVNYVGSGLMYWSSTPEYFYGGYASNIQYLNGNLYFDGTSARSNGYAIRGILDE